LRLSSTFSHEKWVSFIEIFSWSLSIFNWVWLVSRPKTVHSIWEEKVRCSSFKKSKNSIEWRCASLNSCVNIIEILSQEHTIQCVQDFALVFKLNLQSGISTAFNINKIFEFSMEQLLVFLGINNVKGYFKRNLLQALRTGKGPVHVDYTCSEQGEFKLQIAKSPWSSAFKDHGCGISIE